MHSMKTFLFFIFLIGWSSAMSQEVVTTQGDSYSNSNGSIDFTIGETIIFTGTDGSHDITQGFHQTGWNLVELDDVDPLIEIIVFPNPINEYLNIRTTDFDGVKFVLSDASGRLVLEGNLESQTSVLQVGKLAPGQYNLSLYSDVSLLKVFKLQKTH